MSMLNLIVCVSNNSYIQEESNKSHIQEESLYKVPQKNQSALFFIKLQTSYQLKCYRFKKNTL